MTFSIMAKVKNLIGQTFGHLMVVSLAPKEFWKNGASYWYCKCDCGDDELYLARGTHLTNGGIKSCHLSRDLNLVGKRFGRLTVKFLAPKELWKNLKNSYWVCLCDCGETKTVQSSHLLSGNTTSCGCVNAEKASERLIGNENRLTHGSNRRGERSNSYQSWAHMIQRCTNEKNHAYKDYGGRGITIHPRWMIFKYFLEDMGERPDGLELDRIDNDGNYEPGNCKWSTRKEQMNNTRISKRNNVIK